MQSIYRTLPQLSLRLLHNSARMSSTSSIVTTLKSDHANLYTAYDKYVAAQGNADEQERWANQFRWELARHSVGEELVVYPAFEKNLGAEGKRMADEDRAEHQTIKELLYKLESTSVTDSTFRSTFDTLMTNLRQHIKGEEEQDLPKFEKAISREESASLARSFERTKMFVPTHSHPSAPDKPPFETIAGLMAAPLDKLRDLFAKFPDNK